MHDTTKSTASTGGGAGAVERVLQLRGVAGQLPHLAVPVHRDQYSDGRAALLDHGVLAFVNSGLHPLRELVTDDLDARQGQLHHHARSVQGPVRSVVLLERHHCHVSSHPVRSPGGLAGVFSVRFICRSKQQQATRNLIARTSGVAA